MIPRTTNNKPETTTWCSNSKYTNKIHIGIDKSVKTLDRIPVDDFFLSFILPFFFEWFFELTSQCILYILRKAIAQVWTDFFEDDTPRRLVV